MLSMPMNLLVVVMVVVAMVAQSDCAAARADLR